MIDATRMRHLARDNGTGISTAYRYVHEALDVLAARAPRLRRALLASHYAGHTHFNLDGALISANRVAVQGPTIRKGPRHNRWVDFWWSGKHRRHGGNVQVVTAPDGWPIWVSPVRPGREHDTTSARIHTDLLPALIKFGDAGQTVLTDLGYEGERARLTCPHKVPSDRGLSVDERSFNRVHAYVRARAGPRVAAVPPSC